MTLWTLEVPFPFGMSIYMLCNDINTLEPSWEDSKMDDLEIW